MIIFPVVRSKAAKLLFTAEAGQWTSPVPSQTASKGFHGVPSPVIVLPTDILTIGLAGSVLSVFNHVTVSTEPPPVSSAQAVSKSLLLLLISFWLAVPHRGTHTPLLPCGQVRTCFS